MARENLDTFQGVSRKMYPKVLVEILDVRSEISQNSFMWTAGIRQKLIDTNPKNLALSLINNLFGFLAFEAQLVIGEF